MTEKNLNQIVAEEPFPDFAEWWPMGSTFLGFMSEAIVSQWRNIQANDGSLENVEKYVSDYLDIVFSREAAPSLVARFVNGTFSPTLQSGEFDALSYGFYRSAFELIERHIDAYDHPLERERRLFTKRVGRVFFRLMRVHLALDLPAGLDEETDFVSLKDSIERIGEFLKSEGYLRDHFAFTFDVKTDVKAGDIEQTDADFLADLHNNGIAYALYEMGYPVILPSAVYLFHTMGEAQHHSSRTIEELFAMVGYEGRETDDFDPTGYPSEMVVELWEIRAVG